MRLQQYINEEMTTATVGGLDTAFEKYKKDPLYNAVFKAKDKKELQKALETLKSIRGPQAIKNLRKVFGK